MNLPGWEKNLLKGLMTWPGLPKFCSTFGVLCVGHTPSTAGTFRKKFRKDPGNALRAFPGISLESTAGMPQAL